MLFYFNTPSQSVFHEYIRKQRKYVESKMKTIYTSKREMYEYLKFKFTLQEDVASLTMNKYRKAQQLIEEAEHRADNAEKNLAAVRRTRSMSVSREVTKVVRVWTTQRSRSQFEICIPRWLLTTAVWQLLVEFGVHLPKLVPFAKFGVFCKNVCLLQNWASVLPILI